MPARYRRIEVIKCDFSQNLHVRKVTGLKWSRLTMRRKNQWKLSFFQWKCFRAFANDKGFIGLCLSVYPSVSLFILFLRVGFLVFFSDFLEDIWDYKWYKYMKLIHVWPPFYTSWKYHESFGFLVFFKGIKEQLSGLTRYIKVESFLVQILLCARLGLEIQPCHKLFCFVALLVAK